MCVPVMELVDVLVREGMRVHGAVRDVEEAVEGHPEREQFDREA